VGYAWRNFLVPVPRVASWEELNGHLLGECRKRRDRKLWGQEETIAQRFERDREKLLPLPATPYEACERRTTPVSSQALVRYETNDYSVPLEYGHRQVLVKAFVWELVISFMSEVIARHKRSYGREEMIFDPLHYLSLLEQKSNALDQAACWPVAVAGGIRGTPPADGRAIREAWTPGVCTGAAIAGDVFSDGSHGGGAAGAASAGNSLRCSQASGAVALSSSDRRSWTWRSTLICRLPSDADAGRRLPGAAGGDALMNTRQVLLENYLKQLRLPTMVREYRKLGEQCAGEQCAKEGTTFEVFLLRLVESEMMDRERRATERRITAAKFPVSKSLESYNFLDMPTLNKKLVVELARCEWIGRRENVLALGNFGTGKTHIGLALGLAACQQGFRVRFATAVRSSEPAI
jgi:hypothetical protein